MAIDWKKFETVFRLLAAVHAALGEDAFKGKFGRIAELFGPEASYDAIKSEWKKVARLGDDLWRRRHGQPPRARATQSTFPRRRHRHPRVSIKPETHDIIDLDGNEAFREPYLSSIRAKKVPVSNHATRKHKLDIDASPEPESSNTRDRTKRVRLDPELSPSVVRNGDVEPDDRVDYHTLPRYSDNLLEQIRRAVSETPANNTTLNFRMVASSSIVAGPPRVQPGAALQPSRPTSDQDLSLDRREPSHCQVSITEDDRRYWEAVQQPPPAMVTAGELQTHQLIRATPEAGPSRITSNGYGGAYQDKYRAPSFISLSGSDRCNTRGGEAEKEAQTEASTALDKGKGRMVTPPPRPSHQGPMLAMPPTVSYINTTYGICYLCEVRFGTVRELFAHERGGFHSNMLTNDESLEKAQARLEKYGLFEQFCSKTDNQVMDLLAANGLHKVQRESRTIIRGPDRAVEVGEQDELDQSSSQDVVEVSRTEFSAYRKPGKNNVRAHLRRTWVTTVKNSEGRAKAKLSKPPKIVPTQMARILQRNKFSRSDTVDRVLTILERVLPANNNKTAPKCLNQFSSQAPTQLPRPYTSAAADSRRFPTTRAGPNIWIVDAEFASLKGQGNRYDFSVNITNLASGETIVNHRLALPIPVDDLEKKIHASRSWQARHQFVIHHRQPCSMPIITPAELARMLTNGGFGPRDFVFVWASSNVDYNVVHDFLARRGLQHNLMPPQQNVVRVLYAWKELLPRVPCRLDRLFELVFPNSPLRYVHHIADVDTKKLGLMTWKLRDLTYVPHGQHTEFYLFS